MNRPSINKIRLIALKDLDGILERLPKENADNAKRQLRKPLLSALDIYDKNISKGRVEETAEQKKVVDTWYKDICDLKEKAFKYIPAFIKKYSEMGEN